LDVAIIVSFILIVDQLSKFYISRVFEPYMSQPLVDGVLHITYVQNTGAAFGILADRTKIFIFVAIVIVVVMLRYFKYVPRDNYLLRLGLTLGLSGAIGNLIDRIRLGYVIDFIDFKVWPVFNVADSAIFLGVIALLLGIARLPKTEEDNTNLTGQTSVKEIQGVSQPQSGDES
jgi:signal peptidase II